MSDLQKNTQRDVEGDQSPSPPVAQPKLKLLTCDVCGYEIMPGHLCLDCIKNIHGLVEPVAEPFYFCNKCGYSGREMIHPGCNYHAALYTKAEPKRGVEEILVEALNNPERSATYNWAIEETLRLYREEKSKHESERAWARQAYGPSLTHAEQKVRDLESERPR